MSRRRSGSNAFIETLKFLVARKNHQKFGRSRQRFGLWASEALESRELLSSTSLGGDFTQYQAIAPHTSLKADSDFLTGPNSGLPLDIAISYLQSQTAALGLTGQDIDSLKVTNNYRSSGSQVTHIYFQQVVNGIPVVNSTLNINISKNGEVINVGSSILPSVAANTPAPDPQLSAIQALNSLVTSLGWTYEGTPHSVSAKPLSASQETMLSSTGISMAAEIPASLRYVPGNGGNVELAWLLNIQTTDSSSWYDAAVSASSGQILNLEDWVNQASYRGIEIPFENPLEHATALIVNPESRTNSSPFGWHDTDGVTGPEFTDTRGNNVFAQEDKDANDTGGARPDGGAGLVFDFPFDPSQGAQANENAAIVNLFYWNNVIHDVLYNYGFDEASGNFQANNYGNGGLGGDQVEADALDGSGTDNANFVTPPDGTSGRMQMYEFTSTSPTRDSDMDSFIIVHEFGHGLSNRLTGGPANSGALNLAQSRGMGEGWSDFLGLMFVQKATDTQLGAYSTGNYVQGNPLNDPNGGFRHFPYSFDKTVDPTTYCFFNAFGDSHANGEIIAAALWDLNWLLINGNGTSITAKGYEPDIYNFASGAGNTELMQVYVEALKLQPANPTYLDFRGAMLSADLVITGGENEVAIWTAFARRGMGWSAFDGGNAASNNVQEAFDLPPGLLFEFTVTPNPVSENAGVGGATAVIKRPTTAPISAALVVTLTSNDITEIQVPATITIPAGLASVTFPINIIDDTLLDGTQIVQLTGTATIAGQLRTATTVVSVLDYEALSVQVNRTSVREDAGPGAASLTVTRLNTNGELVVTLTNSDLSEVSIPLTMTIPAGSQSNTILLDAVDDNILDGLQLATLTAAAVGYQPGSATIGVEDAEGILIDVIATEFSESAGNGATQVRVSRTDIKGPFAYVAKQNFSNAGVYDIPDGGIILSPIVVPSQTSRLTDVDVEVNFQHAWLGDLDIFLVSPNGTRVELFTDLVSNGSRMTNTILDDEANQSILRGTAPYSGSFRPEGLLSRFQQESPAGTWFLEVTDDRTSDIGKLLSWSMTMTTEGLAPATVVLQTSNLNKAGFGNSATKTVVIPANQAEVLVPLDAVDNKILDGNTVVTISAISVNVPGLALGSDTVIVTDKETLTLSVSNSSVSNSSVSEAAGPGALMGTLTRENTDIGLPYTVTLSSSNTGKLTVPTTLTIPANKEFVTFLINAIDNNVVDGDVVVTLTAQTADYGADVTVDINVLDLEPALKLTTATQSVSENAGSLNVTVTRLDQSDLSAAMVVSLTSGPGLTVPATITIPTGQDKVTFSAGIIDNAILDGTRNSNIHAAGNLITAGDLGIKITDYETLSVTVDKSSFLENAGAGAATGTVRRSNTGNLGQALVVALASSDKTELKVPATVTIPAGQASVTFLIDAVNDPLLDDSQNVTITATSAGYIKGTAEIVVLDHEPPVLTGPAATTPSSRPRITWNALAGALRYDVWVSNLSTGVAQILRNVNVPTNSYVPPENLGIGRYRVWVRAIDQLEQPGFWSVGRDFFINTPAVITSPTPGGAIVDSKFPTIVWSAIPDATEYEVWANNLTTGQIRVINRTGANALTTTSYVSTEGLGSGTYQIWVRGLNAQREAGLWSTPVTYTVLAPPTITQPTGGGTFDRTPTFGWTAVTGATNYDVRIDTTKTNEVVFRDQFVTKTSFTATKDMANGEYRIWVRAQYGTSFSVWSVAKTFSVGLPPQITSVKTVGTPEKPQLQFNWTTISGTEKYELWVNNKATNVRVIYQTNLTTTTFTSPTTLPAGTYRVWVRAVSTMGEITDWSTPVDHVIAASDLPKESLLDVMPASLIFDDGPLARHGSTVQRPEKSAAKADAPITADAAPVTELPALPALPAASMVTSMISVEPAPTVVADHDAVMSEWQSADWWAETSASQVRNDLQPAASARRRG